MRFPQIFSLEGETALITGGGTGIGQAIAQCMYEAGATVALVGRREEELSRAVSELGERAHYFVHDITEMDQADRLATRVEGKLGPITCLVNNAGKHLKKAALETSTDEFLAVLNTNVIGTHALIKAIAPGMVERQKGSILFTASMASLFGIPQVIAYSAAKSAHLGMVRSLSTELSPNGVRVNAIAPGWIETEMSRKALDNDQARKDKILGRTPMHKLGQPSDVGWAAVYLASPAAAFITGTILPVDGGASIGF
ncbi:SDR family oxidoreductase [Pelagicoccus sp. SDUM812003]|uniref:SDR family NAD(P)-dependent oxidoreductase n=1 Tax=Pelagicoccus sp. SDUM812003 TaxID=3041267 RepID=UPI00280D92B3|nr:SDR family oxidoreductase [Pelagicoccus sp. SDUM812003]MDQ8201943.1 SDR family oxidoreductase [Pelagicoccus sp. SDUM812003]